MSSTLGLLVPVPAPGTQAITLGAELSELESAALSPIERKPFTRRQLRYTYAWFDQHGLDMSDSTLADYLHARFFGSGALTHQAGNFPQARVSEVHARWSSPLPKARQSCGARPPRSVQG